MRGLKNRWASRNWRAKWHWNMIFALLKKFEYDFTDEWNSAASKIWFCGVRQCHLKVEEVKLPVMATNWSCLSLTAPNRKSTELSTIYYRSNVHNLCSLCVEHIHASRFRFQIRFIIKVRNQNWQLRIFIISRYFLFVQTVVLSDWFNRSVLIYIIFPALTWLPFIFGYHPIKKIKIKCTQQPLTVSLQSALYALEAKVAPISVTT